MPAVGSILELRAAIRRNNIPAIRAEIEAGAPVNSAKGEYTEGVLEEAAGDPSVTLDTLRALVEAGADPAVDAIDIMHKAASTGQLERVKFFEELGCPVAG